MNTVHFCRDSQCAAIFRGQGIGYNWMLLCLQTRRQQTNAQVKAPGKEGAAHMLVVAYLRVSSIKQQEAYGPHVQRKAIRQWAKAHGHIVIAWYIDVISGASELHERAGWRDAAELVKTGTAHGVVVARLDRLARDVMVQEYLLRNLTEFGGVVLSARDSENEMLTGESKDPSRKMIRTILGAVSEYDREMTVDRLAAARAAKAAHGGYAHGALPYGYRSVAGTLAPIPAEQQVLTHMRKLAAQGHTYRHIADSLNNDGIPAKRGGTWTHGAVARIIKRNNLHEQVA
ncbi:recombinase family protein [Mycobacteroides abscessus]|uniref:recombinase family protein n=1 Tax=Mycobacteroides abscessus TaxID=36809 RepID=UPI000E6861F5|nr:recombinase family protein [Mycobacteroides abscessus]RIT57913.1 resolvase [Mycobacteroides abscessus]